MLVCWCCTGGSGGSGSPGNSKLSPMYEWLDSNGFHSVDISDFLQAYNLTEPHQLIALPEVIKEISNRVEASDKKKFLNCIERLRTARPGMIFSIYFVGYCTPYYVYVYMLQEIQHSIG